MRGRLAAWGPAILVSGLIFLASSRTWSLPASDTGVVLAKLAHVTEFGLLAAAVRRGLLFEGARLSTALVAAVLAAVLFGMTDEYHQAFVEGRNSSLVDLLPDGLGGLLGVIVSQVVSLRLSRF